MHTDVLIIGSGLAGTAAADEIVRNGNISVIQLSDGSGASPCIHGFCMPIGKGDSEELFYEDTMRSGYYQSDPVLVHQLCAKSLKLGDYFKALGLAFDRDETGIHFLHSLGSTVPRIVGIQNNTGAILLNRLHQRLEQAEHYRKLSHQRALELICKNQRVVGARCYDEKKNCFYSIYSRVVILASGGFGRIFPESTNPVDIGGDGCAMAYLAGAALTDMEFIQFEPSAAVWPPKAAGKAIITTMFYDGAVLRNKSFKRFMLDYSDAGECVSKDVLSKCICSEIITNGSTPHGGVWFDASGVPNEKWQGAYQPYLERYQACGIDLRREPVEIAPAAHTTCGGVKIDKYCRTNICGLIVCGEAAGGLHGANRLGGNAGLETIVFGRIAGQTAILDANRNQTLKDPEEYFDIKDTEEEISNIPADIKLAALRIQLQDVIRNSLNVVRSRKRLENGMHIVKQMMKMMEGHQYCYEKHRMYNDLLTTYLTMVSALERDSSAGCHYREDGIEKTENYRIVLKNNGGHMDVCRQTICGMGN